MRTLLSALRSVARRQQPFVLPPAPEPAACGLLEVTVSHAPSAPFARSPWGAARSSPGSPSVRAATAAMSTATS